MSFAGNIAMTSRSLSMTTTLLATFPDGDALPRIGPAVTRRASWPSFPPNAGAATWSSLIRGGKAIGTGFPKSTRPLWNCSSPHGIGVFIAGRTVAVQLFPGRRDGPAGGPACHGHQGHQACQEGDGIGAERRPAIDRPVHPQGQDKPSAASA